MVRTLENKDSRSQKHIWTTSTVTLEQDLDGQRDGIQKQTLQGSCQEIRYGIFNSFTPLQTTEQWKNRRISQIPENMYGQPHQLWIGVGQTHTNGNGMLKLLPELQCQRISILRYVWKRPDQ